MNLKMSFSKYLSLLFFITASSLSAQSENWLLDSQYEVYFTGSFSTCEEQEVLSKGSIELDENLKGLESYYHALTTGETIKVLSEYSKVDGSYQRVKDELESEPNKFASFKELTSVTAKCTNLWGQYRFFDVMWDKDFSWLDVQFCDASNCDMSDFFLTIDDHSQFHSIALEA